MKKLTFLILFLIAGFYSIYANTCYRDSGNIKHSGSPPCTPPVVTITSDTTVCEGTIVTLTATGGGTYSWSTGQTTSSIQVMPLITTNYSIVVTVATCSNNASTTVNVVPGSYGLYIIPTTATVCPGGSVNFSLSGSGPYSCTWSPSTFLICSSCNTTTCTPTSSITYTVNIADGVTGCNTIVTVPVTVSSSLTAVISGPATICKGNYATLTASGGSTYLWNTGATNNIISVNPSSTTTYKVKVASGTCCDSTTFSLTVDSCGPAAINTISQNSSSVSLYPNPNNGQFTLAFSHPEFIPGYQTILEIYNILGARIYNRELNQVVSENYIKIGNQPSGIYFYRVSNEHLGLVGEGKFIIK